MTTISDTFTNPAGTGVGGVTVRATLVAASEVLTGGGAIIREAETTTASDGTWSLTLTPISSLAVSDGAYYLVAADGHRWTIDVPDTGTYALDEVQVEPAPLPATGASSAALAAHLADTTDVHGVVDTATLVSSAAVIADDAYVRGAGGARGVEGRTPAEVAQDIGALVTFARTVLAPEPGRRWFLGTDPFDAELTAIAQTGDRFTYAEGHAQEGETYRWSGVTWVLTQTLPALPASVLASVLGIAITTDQTINADLTVADPGVKGYRLRRSGGALDFEGTGAKMHFSVWSGSAFDGSQRVYMVMEDGAQVLQLIENVQWRESADGTERHRIVASTGVASLGSKNGLANVQFCGWIDEPNAPTTDTWATGDVVLDSAGGWHLCTAGGSPGTWT